MENNTVRMHCDKCVGESLFSYDRKRDAYICFRCGKAKAVVRWIPLKQGRSEKRV